MLTLAGLGVHALIMKFLKAFRSGIKHGDYEGNELQLPALFIVDENRKVIKAHYGKDIMDMPSVDELIDII